MTVLGKAALTVILGLFSGLAYAETGSYQIELIVFSQTSPNTESFEQTTSQIIWPPGLVELSNYKQPEHTTLDDSYAVLSQNSSYKPIAHVAWIQPDSGAPLHIQSADGKLNGYLQMQREQNLQLTVDLELGPYRGKTSIYRLNEKRHVKPNELYYLDHPKFGIIVKASPL
ncbi:MAG: CsiV family protein [Methylobacter sp.]